MFYNQEGHSPGNRKPVIDLTLTRLGSWVCIGRWKTFGVLIDWQYWMTDVWNECSRSCEIRRGRRQNGSFERSLKRKRMEMKK